MVHVRYLQILLAQSYSTEFEIQLIIGNLHYQYYQLGYWGERWEGEWDMAMAVD